jgi:hypothetical protein
MGKSWENHGTIMGKWLMDVDFSMVKGGLVDAEPVAVMGWCAAVPQPRHGGQTRC